MQKNTLIAVPILIFLATGGLWYYIYSDISASKVPMTQESESMENTLLGTAVEAVEGIETEEYGENSPVLGDNPNISFPDLEREIVFYDDTTPEAQEKITKKIEDITQVLKANNDAFIYWIELGQYWKLIGDYEGTRDAWEYAGAIRPRNSLSFGNLADLYGYYIKDFSLAEKIRNNLD